MPLLTSIARRKKLGWFLEPLPKHSRILEIGCGDGWVREYACRNGWSNYVGLDLVGPADYVGDIRDWRKIGLSEASFDAIIAFELVEHVDCFQEMYDMCVPGGLLLLTSPLPSRDWAMRILETMGLNQKRTSPHDRLIDFRNVPLFELVELRIVAGLSQWGKFRKRL